MIDSHSATCHSSDRSLRARSPVASDLDNCIVAGDGVALRTDYALLERVAGSSLPWSYHTFVETHGGKTFEQILSDTRRELGLPYNERLVQDLISEELEQVVAAIERGELEEVPGAARVIRALVGEGRDLFIVSSSHRSRVEASVRAVGLGDIVASEQIKSAQSDYAPPRPKPDPSCYIDMTLARMAHDTSRAWAIEDSVTGLTAAAAARDNLQAQLAERGFEFPIIWFTGLVEPKHYPVWKRRALELHVPFEVTTWDQIPHLFDLVESGKKAEAEERYGLRR